VTTQDVAFATAIPIANINSSIKLEVSQENTVRLKIGSDFALSVVNHGDKPVLFSYDWGTKLFTYSPADAKWVLVENQGEYGVKTDIVLDDKEHGPNWQGILYVWPNLPKGQQPVTVRVVVVGKLQSNNPSPKDDVAAYIDVTLPP
jgi:hypothetical protein